MFTEFIPGKTKRIPKSRVPRIRLKKVVPEMVTLGQQMRILREMRNISRSELSKQCGVSESVISCIEKGERGNMRSLNLILKHLGGTLVIIPIPVPSWVDSRSRAVEMKVRAVRSLTSNEIEPEDTEEKIMSI